MGGICPQGTTCSPTVYYVALGRLADMFGRRLISVACDVLCTEGQDLPTHDMCVHDDDFLVTYGH